jgi:hypothetical protein
MRQVRGMLQKVHSNEPLESLVLICTANGGPNDERQPKADHEEDAHGSAPKEGNALTTPEESLSSRISYLLSIRYDVYALLP